MSISAAPGWAETSVRWLQTNAYISALKGRPFEEILMSALVKMKYRHSEMVGTRGFNEDAWKNHLKNEIITEPGEPSPWNKVRHEAMVKFVKAGGFRETERVRLVLEEKVMIKGMTPEGVVLDEIGLVLEDLEDAVMAEPTVRRPQLSPAHELEEAVADVMLRRDPRFGVW